MGNIEKGIIAKLGLTKAQNDKVTTLMKLRGDKLKALMEKTQKTDAQKRDRQAFRAEFQKVQTWYQGELKSVIGAQKFAKYEAMVKAEREKMAKQSGATAGKGAKGAGKGGGKG